MMQVYSDMRPDFIGGVETSILETSITIDHSQFMEIVYLSVDGARRLVAKTTVHPGTTRCL
jgi:hypothetical protein